MSNTNEAVSLTIEEQIEATAAAGAAILAESERRRQEAEALEAAHEEALRLDAWRPALDAIRAVLPAWAHEHLQEPYFAKPEGYDEFYNGNRSYPVKLLLPNCAPIFVYATKRSGMWTVDFSTAYGFGVKFDEFDEFGDAGYIVVYDGGRSCWTGDVSYHPKRFPAVVHLARAAWPEMQAAQSEADRKNAERAAPPDPKPEPEQRSPLEVALAQFEHFYDVDEENEHRFDQSATAAIAYSAVAIAEQLARVAELLEQTSRPAAQNDGSRHWVTYMETR